MSNEKREPWCGCLGKGDEIRPSYVGIIIKGSLDEKLPIYEQDPKSKRLDLFEKRFVRD